MTEVRFQKEEDGCISGVNQQPVSSIRNREGYYEIYKAKISIGTTEPAMLMDAGRCGEPKVL